MQADYFVEVLPWKQESILQVANQMLKSENRSLTSDQIGIVVEAVKRCPTPLFLKLCMITSTKWRSYDLPDLTQISARTVRDILISLFDDVSKTHGRCLTHTALGLLTVSDGLSFEELLDILSMNDDVLNDVFEWWLPPVSKLTDQRNRPN